MATATLAPSPTRLTPVKPTAVAAPADRFAPAADDWEPTTDDWTREFWATGPGRDVTFDF